MHRVCHKPNKLSPIISQKSCKAGNAQFANFDLIFKFAIEFGNHCHLFFMVRPSLQYNTIKFKCEKGVNFDFETKKVDFLDTTLWVDSEGYIQSTLFTKPDRVVQYLLPSSSHPSHITRNIPYSLAYRLRRIESTETLFESNLVKLEQELLQRGYSKTSVRTAFAKVKTLTRDSTLEKVVKQADGRVTLVIPFDKRLPNI